MPDEEWFPSCPGCGAELAWANGDLALAALGLASCTGLAAFALIEGVRERNWWRVGGAVVILTICAAYVVSQLRQPRYKPVDAGSPEARQGIKELQ